MDDRTLEIIWHNLIQCSQGIVQAVQANMELEKKKGKGKGKGEG